MLADALRPHGGVVIWRAFVYCLVGQGPREAGLRRVQAARRQVREQRDRAGQERPDRLPAARAVLTRCSARCRTRALAMEVQITKEYLGFNTHLAYLGPMWEEALKSRTARPHPSVDRRRFAERNGGRRQHRQRPQLERVAVRPGELVRVRPARLGPASQRATIADEWTRMTWGNDPRVVDADRRR